MVMPTVRRSLDRRVARTKSALHGALKSLILRRRYDEITIKEICATADVGRATFYAHYSGKDDLKRDGLERLRTRLLEEVNRNGARRFAFSLALFEHAREHRHLYHASRTTRGGTIALGMIRKIVSELVRKEFATGGAPPGIPRELVVEYVVGAYISVLIWWLDGGAKLPAEEIDASFQRLLPTGTFRVDSPIEL
jgi:AcrR family transcriptional regulator